jgi:hypothetical protein
MGVAWGSPCEKCDRNAYCGGQCPEGMKVNKMISVLLRFATANWKWIFEAVGEGLRRHIYI